MKNNILSKSVLAITLIFSLAFLGLKAEIKNDFVSSTVIPEETEIGTYQIQVVNSRNMPNIPGNIDEIVRTNRKTNEVVYIKLDDYIRIKILSTDEISAPDFQPLPQIVHIEE